jgi:trigger factor
MKTEIIKQDHIFQREIEVTIEPEEIEPIIAEEKKKVRRQAEVPGFRKGKAPAPMVEKRFSDVIYRGVIDSTIQAFYGKAIDSLELKPVIQGEIKDINYENLGDPMVFQVYTEVEPEISIKALTGNTFTKQVRTYSEADYDEYVQGIRNEHGTASQIDGPAAMEDTLVLDVGELDENDAVIEGKSYEDFSVKLGSGQFDKDLEEQLVGLKLNEEKSIAKILEGKEENSTERYRVKVKSIQRIDLPVFDDEFVKSLGDFKDIADFKEKTEQSIKQMFKQEAEKSLQQDIVDTMIEDNDFEVPEKMVENELEVMLINAGAYGQKIDANIFRDYYRSAAERNVRWSIIKKAIVRDIDVKLEDSDIENYLKEMKWEEKQVKEAMQNDYYKKQIELDVQQKKVFDYLIDNGKVEENDITPKPEDKK